MTSDPIRSAMCKTLALDLIGPGPDDTRYQQEVLHTAPSAFYLTGFLVPYETPLADKHDLDDDDPEDPTAAGGEDGQEADDRASTRRSFFPSSMGLSVLVPEDTRILHLTVTWGDYAPKEGPAPTDAHTHFGAWQRRPGLTEVTFSIDPAAMDAEGRFPPHALGTGLYVTCHRRMTEVDGDTCQALSLYVVNRRKVLRGTKRDAAYAFQVCLAARAERFVGRQNTRGRLAQDPDELAADLQYRDVFEFATGHNVSCRWDVDTSGICRRVCTEWMPRALIYRTDHRMDDTYERSMETLGDASLDGAALKAKLSPLVTAYEAWLDAQEQQAATLSSDRADQGRRMLRSARRTAARMAEGIDLLEDPTVRKAFQTANRCVAHAYRQRGKQQTDAPVAAPSWRAFQLGFILLNLPGLANPGHKDRKLVDLLFFPTGGGKTEAYLGLAAFSIVLRRLRDGYPEGGGLTVLMRYTLRLLTLDQMDRATALICALELERKTGALSGELGGGPFEIGLWVGQSATPNHLGYKGDRDTKGYTAYKRLLDYRKSASNPSPIPLRACPWCGTAIGAEQMTLVDDQGRKNETKDHAKNLLVRCKNRSCDFHKPGLPVVCVDDAIYRRLPCFLIATVDKLAALPWVGKTGMLLGKVTKGHKHLPIFHGPGMHEKPDAGLQGLGKPMNPPALIIQDELHLITGPLGTMVGLYETALDAVCRDGGRPAPKIVASTATVRRAQSQIQAVFGRGETDIFPPPGLSRKDSYFAHMDEKADADARARLYLGLAAPGRSLKVAYMRMTMSLMAAAAYHADAHAGTRPNPADPYMTLVSYFNSLRELGGSRRIVEEDVRFRLETYAEVRRRDGEALGASGLGLRKGLSPKELTSRVRTDEVAVAKLALTRPFDHEDKVDVALATNMISVGLDIPRLGLMTVMGQPKTTSEYIQATSRVGRDKDRPGLVVTLYNMHRPRDRSHYERFTHWHDGFYRGVEPNSVTPFSSRALDRGLAAITVAMARHLHPVLSPPMGAGKVAALDAVREQVRDLVLARLQDHRTMKEDTEEELRRYLDDKIAHIFDRWHKLASEAPQQYGTELPRTNALLQNPADKASTGRALFRLPWSMREVEPKINLFAMTLEKDKQARSRTLVGQINRLQMITLYGPGAMMDLPKHAVMVGGYNDWTPGLQIKDARLESYLRGIFGKNLTMYEPRFDSGDPKRPDPGVFCHHFPKWYVGEQVEEYKDAESGKTYQSRPMFSTPGTVIKNGKVEFGGKRIQVSPVRFVAACKHGHVQDISWRYYLFGEKNKVGQLWLDERGAGGDLSEVFVRCSDTGTRKGLAAMMWQTTGGDGHESVLGLCGGFKPWLGFVKESEREEGTGCGEDLRLLVRTASNAYFTKTLSGISIPMPESALRQKVENWKAEVDFDTLEAADIHQYFTKFLPKDHPLKEDLEPGDAEGLKAREAEVWRLVQVLRGEVAEDRTLKGEELKMMLAQPVVTHGSEPRGSAEERERLFVARGYDPKFVRVPADHFGKMVLVHRLREVVVQVGFSRFQPERPNTSGSYDNQKGDLLTQGDLTWLPAAENQGEGFLLTLNPDAVAAWEARPGVRKRILQLQRGFESHGDRTGTGTLFPGAPYILLHSLAHVLIMAVSLECGYASTAIKERIYVENGQYGILLYTWSPASEGTLGGLIACARNLDGTLAHALEMAGLCSNDPVCSMHLPENKEEERFLHGAACHGCLLISETCCEMYNEFLDRALVVPTVEIPDAAFFGGRA